MKTPNEQLNERSFMSEIDIIVQNAESRDDFKKELKKFLEENAHDKKAASTAENIEQLTVDLYDNREVEVEEGVMSFAQFSKLYEEKKVDEYYQVSYYAQVGEHGGLKERGNFEETFKEAVRKKKEWKDDLKDDAKPNEAIWYIGVEGNGDDFAVVFVNDKYLKNTDEKHFKSKDAYEAWMAVAKKALETGKPQKGKYNDDHVSEARAKTADGIERSKIVKDLSNAGLKSILNAHDHIHLDGEETRKELEEILQLNLDDDLIDEIEVITVLNGE